MAPELAASLINQVAQICGSQAASGPATGQPRQAGADTEVLKSQLQQAAVQVGQLQLQVQQLIAAGQQQHQQLRQFHLFQQQLAGQPPQGQLPSVLQQIQQLKPELPGPPPGREADLSSGRGESSIRSRERRRKEREAAAAAAAPAAAAAAASSAAAAGAAAAAIAVGAAAAAGAGN